MELTVLGTDGGYPRPGGACSGYLVRHEGFALVVDLGTGALANLQRHLPHERIDAIVLSHEHPDHTVDLYPLYVARAFHAEPLPPLPLYGPSGAFDRVARLSSEGEGGGMRGSFEVAEVEPGTSFEVGPFRVDTRPLPHLVPNIGMRISADGAVLAYTGDSGPSEEVEAIARGADVLLAEASMLGDATVWFHLSAREAAEHAARAGVARLVLSHFWPTRSRERSREEAAAAYPGDVVLAEEGMEVTIGA